MKQVKKSERVAVKRQYECLYIIENTVNEEKRKELIDKFSKMAGSDCKIEKWGMKKFATPINYKKDGFYVLMNFTSLPEVPKKIADLMNITEGIVRYMFVNKEGVKVNPKRKEAPRKEKIENPTEGETA